MDERQRRARWQIRRRAGTHRTGLPRAGLRACGARRVPYHAAVQNRLMLLAATVSAALVGGALVYGLDHGAAKAAPPPPPAAGSLLADPLPEPSAPPPALAAAPPSARASTAAPSRFESLSQKVDRLGRSSDPVDAFAAYQLVTACVWARDHEGWMAHHILPGDRAMLST